MNEHGSVAGTKAPEAPGEFVLDEFVPYYLNRITTRLNKDLADALRGINVSTPQWRVISVLNERDGRSLSELSAYTITDQSTLSRIIDRMEDSGLVERRARLGDGRYIEVFLTARGRAVFERIWPVAASQYRRSVAGLRDDELAALIATLKRILANIRKSRFE